MRAAGEDCHADVEDLVTCGYEVFTAFMDVVAGRAIVHHNRLCALCAGPEKFCGVLILAACRHNENCSGELRILSV